MGLSRKSRRLAAGLLTVFIGGEVSVAAADVLVLRSSGPSQRRYPAGQRLPDNTSFALRPGDVVIVLVSGGTRTLRGPVTTTAFGPARSAGATVGPRRNTGAVRGVDGVAVGTPLRAGDVWHWDVTRSGRACIPTGTRPTLWRPATAATQLTITPPNGTAQTIAWPEGQHVLPWPAAVALSDGASYQLSWTGEPTPRRITVQLVAPPSGDEALAMALHQQDCQSQLDVFIAQRTVREAAVAAPATPAQ